MSISATGVTKRFGSFLALDDVCLHVRDRSLTALLGPSGGGKSTLLRVLAGLETPDAGEVRIAGDDVTRRRPRERGIGFVFQHYAAFRHMTVAENIAFGLTVRRRPRASKAEIRARVDELVALVHLEGLAGRYPSQLSGGQRQRMVLARALAVQPRVLLLDEPFGALDAAIRGELREWLRRLHEQIPVTTIVVTHDQEEALDLADQIVLINRGRVEQAGTPTDLYDRPASPFVMSFVGAATRLHGAWHRPHDIDLMEMRPDTPVDISGCRARMDHPPFDAGRSDSVTGLVRRVIALPTHLRVDVDVAGQAEPVMVYLPREGHAASCLAPGRMVQIRPRRSPVWGHRAG